MKYMRRRAGYTWTDYKTNEQIVKELKITPILDKLLEYKRNWIQHINRMPLNRLPRAMKYYSPTGRRNHGRMLMRLLDTWDRNGSTSDPIPWKIYDDDVDYDYDDIKSVECKINLFHLKYRLFCPFDSAGLAPLPTRQKMTGPRAGLNRFWRTVAIAPHWGSKTVQPVGVAKPTELPQPRIFSSTAVWTPQTSLCLTF